ncbi:DUF6022 family protein [Paenibacillus sp. HWE-109]|uniref:DUF6022 family protein n=1 Tax=Paenibacillus sp. HWE-109 TaxID=1306526 RepID=UPI001EDFB15C|nr:DUF6022 family protein [Paenibacillus sp. HWE-109]UKS29151.1 DUF6022 family protein [Paenibacillus sp. HWE-109]
MKPLSTFSKEKQLSIHNLAAYANQVIAETWTTVLEEQRAELIEMFTVYGDRAYGVFIQKFMAPLFEQLAQNEFITRPGFNLADSLEKWGPPEERERCAWYIIEKPDGSSVGTLVLQIFHSHVQFHLPHPPHIMALEETEREDILDALSYTIRRAKKKASDGYQRIHEQETMTKWEYSAETGLADAFRSFKGQSGGSYVDLALAAWGRNGWELVSIVPQQDQLIAFFKRPVFASRNG